MQIAHITIGNTEPLLLIAGPCVIEGEQIVMDIAGSLVELCRSLGMPFVFKASYDKANRTSAEAFRGLGLEKGLEILSRVKQTFKVPVLTDVHESTPIDEVASVVDVFQTPAFLVRQTDFIQKVARAGKPMNIKKGQFQAPWDMNNVVAKCRAVGNNRVMLCDRGVSFGYNTLVSDMRGLPIMRRLGCPVIYDATHSVQQPGGQGTSSGGQREMVPVLARAAVAAGVAGLFMETHPDPENAKSDGPNMWPLGRMRELLETLMSIDRVVKAHPYAEDVEA